MRARVFVTLKPSVFDPQGTTVTEALHTIVVDYEPLTALLDMEEALRAGEVIAHWKVRRGDPAALKSLCHVLFYLGDLHRLFDSWDYPGLGNTDVPEARWNEAGSKRTRRFHAPSDSPATQTSFKLSRGMSSLGLITPSDGSRAPVPGSSPPGVPGVSATSSRPARSRHTSGATQACRATRRTCRPPCAQQRRPGASGKSPSASASTLPGDRENRRCRFAHASRRPVMSV